MALAEYASANPILAGILGTAFVALTGVGLKLVRDRRDSSRIYEHLSKSAQVTDWKFRTTHANASATRLTEARVEALCASHPRFKRNEKEKQPWQVLH